MNGSGFFAVDRRVWALVCHFSLGHAASYLVIARGTGADNLTTAWSVNAIEKYTSISRPKAKAYVADLITYGIMTVTENGTRPRYKLASAEQLEKFCRKVIPLDERPLATPELIWLPNTIVDGASGEIPAIELLRKSHSVDALRLFVNLYYAHDLRWNGGVEWRPGNGLRMEFDRELIGEFGEYRMFGFSRKHLSAGHRASFVLAHFNSDPKKNDARWPSFWEALRLIESLGLLSIVPHLVEADSVDAEIIHPLPFPLVEQNGEPGERAVSDASIRAVAAMLPDWATGSYLGKFDVVAPVPRHVAMVAVVGIPRLFYRPQTEATSAWLAQSDRWCEAASMYLEIAETVVKSRAQSASCNIKERSR